MSQQVKNQPAVQEIQVQSLAWEDPLEKEMATHSSILAWEIPWTELGAWQVQSVGSQKSWTRLNNSSNGFHKCCWLSSLFKFFFFPPFFSSDWITSNELSSDSLIFPSTFVTDSVFCAVEPLLHFSIPLLYSSAPDFLFV